MKRICALFVFLVSFTAPARAQKFARYEVSGGYSLRIYTPPNYTHVFMNGWYASGGYNILSRLSVAAEFSGAYKNQGLNGNLSIHTVLIGPQVYPFGHRHKLTPFAHVLFGEGFYRNHYPAFGGFPSTVVTDSKSSWEAGGGLDLARTSHWEIRMIQADFGQTKFLGNRSQANYRVSVGVVYRFGGK